MNLFGSTPEDLLKNHSQRVTPQDGLYLLPALIAFSAVLSNGFVNLDEPYYLFDNPGHYLDFLDRVGFWFTGNQAGNWHPITMMSHYLDWWLFGRVPIWYHVENLVWHVLNAWLFAYFLQQLRCSRLVALVAATIWLVHPLQVESVVWLAERKNLLSTFFMLLALIQWHRFRCTGDGKIYGYVVLCYAFSLGSKAMTVTFPCLLILLEMGRPLIAFGQEQRRPSFKNLGLSIAPFFLMSLAVSYITWTFQEDVQAVMHRTSFWGPLWHACISYLTYLKQFFWPTELVVFYPLTTPGFVLGLTAFLILLGASGLAIRLRRSRPLVFIGWFWFIGTLVPVIGLVKVGHQAHADRYMYVPIMGLIMMLSSLKLKKPVINVGTGFVLLVLSFLTFQQTRVWRDTSTLFHHALRHTENNWAIHIYLANYYLGVPDHHAALIEVEKALSIRPGQTRALLLKAHIMSDQNRFPEAENLVDEILRLDPGHVDATYLAAWLAWQQGFSDKATNYIKMPQSITSKDPEMWVLSARIEQSFGQASGALHGYEMAVSLRNASRYHNLLADQLMGIGQDQLAEEHRLKAQQVRRRENWPGLLQWLRQ